MTEISNHVAVTTILVLAIAGEGPELVNESTSNEASFFFIKLLLTSILYGSDRQHQIFTLTRIIFFKSYIFYGPGSTFILQKAMQGLGSFSYYVRVYNTVDCLCFNHI